MVPDSWIGSKLNLLDKAAAVKGAATARAR